MLVKPVDIIEQFQFQMTKDLKVHMVRELCFHDLVGGFRHGVSAWTAFHTEIDRFIEKKGVPPFSRSEGYPITREWSYSLYIVFNKKNCSS
ncbi:hypothetical protein D3C74_273010 [compost metagenome]